MSVTIQEELMALGDWSVDIDYRADVMVELQDDSGRPRKVHVLVYDVDEELIYTGVMLRVAGDDTGVTLGGRGMAWWLGGADAGPIIGDREYVSGNNKLSNGGFTLGDLYWSLPSDTVWTITDGAMVSAPRTPNPAIDPPGEMALDHNDIAVSDERFPASAGNEYQATMSTHRPGVDRVGRLWLRIVFGGKFKQRSHFPSFLNEAGTLASWSFDTRAATLGGMGVGLLPAEAPPGSNGRVLRVGPSLFRESIANPSFEADPAIAVNWEVTAGTWTVATGGLDGTNLIYTESVAGRLKNDHDTATGGTNPFAVLPGERYRFEVWVYPSSTPAATGRARMWTFWYHETDSALNMWTSTPELASPTAEEQDRWNMLKAEETVPDGYVAFSSFLATDDVGAGRWSFDHASALRVNGNVDFADSPAFDIVSGRSITWRSLYRSEANRPEGTVQIGVIYYGPYKTTLVEMGPQLQPTQDDAWEQFAFTFTPPSGYDQAALRVMSSDIQFGSYWIGEGELTEDDGATLVYQEPSAWSGTGTVTLDAVAPEGTTDVHVEVVAEREAIDWTVDNVTLARTGVTPATGNAIVADLLDGSPINAGAVTCPEIIPYDWRLLNLTPRQALAHYCDVVSEPARECRINPDRTLDVGTPETVFVDHEPDGPAPVVLLAGDIDVEDLPDVETDVEERATEIKVLGAEREGTDGSSVFISATATAAVAGEPEYDWDGNLLERTRLISDGTVDHLGYARALADDLAAKEAEPALSLSAVLTGADTRTVDVGDWIYVYKPDAGLLDPDNVTTINGETVFPRRVRVLGRTRQLGPSYRIEIRRSDGSTFDLPGVRWSERDETALTIGDRYPEWVNDPQGGAAGQQYLRDRASRPR